MSAILVHVVRSGFVEGVHHGSVVVVDQTGASVATAGHPEAPVFPRSANKPLQAVGMIRAGLRLDAPDLALAAASHSGEPFHIARVLRMLTGGGLDEDALTCPPALPLGEEAAHALLAAGGTPTRAAMNCSGKHAAMLRTCQAAGWALEDYPAVDHPLQKALRKTIEDVVGEHSPVVGVDGCGLPLFALTLTGLARAYLRLVQSPLDSPERAVTDAMRTHPELVGGTGRDVTRLMVGIPGMLAKDGAEGVYAVAVPDVGAVAVKIDDGGARARVPVIVAGLRRLGVTAPILDELAEAPLLGGDRVVGWVRSAW